MPVYVYRVKDKAKGCAHCRREFEIAQKVADKPLEKCPQCGATIEKVILSFLLGSSKMAFDRKAKDQGFHKLKKVDKGKYEKLY